MVDPPVVKRALRTLRTAEELALVPPDWRDTARAAGAAAASRRDPAEGGGAE
jgi:hypothetical protein